MQRGRVRVRVREGQGEGEGEGLVHVGQCCFSPITIYDVTI